MTKALIEITLFNFKSIEHRNTNRQRNKINNETAHTFHNISQSNR